MLIYRFHPFSPCCRFGHNQLQDQINIKSLQRLTQYCERYKEKFGSAAIPLARKAKAASDLLQQLRSQVHARRAKNTDILTLSQEVSLCDGMIMCDTTVYTALPSSGLW